MVSPVSSRAEHSDMSRKLSIEEAGAEERDLVTGMEEIIGQPEMEAYMSLSFRKIDRAIPSLIPRVVTLAFV